MHAWTEDYQDRFLKCTVVAWWFADMQVSYTYFVRRRTYLLKILSSWIIQCEIHLCFFCGNLPSPFDTSLKNWQNCFPLPKMPLIVTYLVYLKMCWKGLYMHFPCSLGDQKCGQQLFQLLPYHKTSVIWGMDANRLVRKLIGAFYTWVVSIDKWSWCELPDIGLQSQNFTASHILLNTRLANLVFIHICTKYCKIYGWNENRQPSNHVLNIFMS